MGPLPRGYLYIEQMCYGIEPGQNSVPLGLLLSQRLPASLTPPVELLLPQENYSEICILNQV